MWKPSDFQENPLVACKATFFESLKLWYKTLLMTFFFVFLYRMAFRIERRIITLVSWPFPNSLPFLVVFYSFWLSSWPFMLKSKLNIQFTNSSANSSIWTMNGKLFVQHYLHIVQHCQFSYENQLFSYKNPQFLHKCAKKLFFVGQKLLFVWTIAPKSWTLWR